MDNQVLTPLLMAMAFVDLSASAEDRDQVPNGLRIAPGMGGNGAGGDGRIGACGLATKPSLSVCRNATTSSISDSLNAGPAEAGRLKGTRSFRILPT